MPVSARLTSADVADDTLLDRAFACLGRQRRRGPEVVYAAQPHFSLFAATCSAVGCSFFS